MRFSVLLDVVIEVEDEERAWDLIPLIQDQVRAVAHVVAAIQCADQLEPVGDTYPSP